VTSSPAARPAQRYGDRGPSRRRPLLIGLAALAVAVGVGFAGWVAVVQARKPVTWSDARVTVLDAARTDVSYTVTAAAGQVVVCTIQVLNDGRAVVGRVDVRIGPSADRTISVTTPVPTTERAAGAEVRACALA
jgi:hypothetical protein